MPRDVLLLIGGFPYFANMELGWWLKDLRTGDVVHGKTAIQVQAENSIQEWMYEICRQPAKIRCTYPPPMCLLSDHIVVGLCVGATTVKLYGLKPRTELLKGNELLEMFEDQFQDDTYAKYFRQYCDWTVRRSKAENFESVLEDSVYRCGDFFCGISTTLHSDSIAVSRQPSVANDDVYRKVQQPVVTGPHMPDTMKRLEKQCSDTSLLTAPNNVASVESNGYNATANESKMLDNCVQQCIDVEQSDKDPATQKDNEALVSGFIVTEQLHMQEAKEEGGQGPKEQVLPNHHAEKLVQFKDSLMVTGGTMATMREEPARCPFLDGRPEDLVCYVHALELTYNVPIATCAQDCKDHLEPYVSSVKRELQTMEQVAASEDLKRYILRHCQNCRRQQCRVPHVAAGCCPPGFCSATKSPSYSMSLQSKAELPVATVPLTKPPVGVKEVSVDPEPYQNSSAVDFAKNPIPERNPDAGCRLHVPTETCGDAAVHIPQAVYILPAPGGKSAHINQLLVQSREDLPHDVSGYLHGTVIYSSKMTENMQDMQHIFSPGSHNSWIPDFLKVPTPSQTLLGRGGNGITFAYTVSDTDFAVKETKYRRSEIQLWRQFDHPNVIPLLAVVSLQSGRCLQFMPQMTCNLREEVGKIISLKSLLSKHNEEFWRVAVYPKLKHILRSTLSGLVHLHNDHRVQHCDLKPHNILIQYQCSHNHLVDSVFCCTAEERCTVKICDFDSVKEFSSTYYKADKTMAKTGTEISKVLGTKGYRAPEKFLKPDLKQDPTSLGAEMEGPWCDIWSFGSCVLFICLGPGDKKDADMFKKEKDDSDERVEPLVRVTSLFTEPPPLHAVGVFAAKCLKPQPIQRPSAQDLLRDLFLS